MGPRPIPRLEVGTLTTSETGLFSGLDWAQGAISKAAHRRLGLSLQRSNLHEMVLPEADWKNQPGDLFDWGTIVVGLALIAVYLYLWWTGGWVVYFIMASVLVAWLIVFFTAYWQPILSLFMVFIIALFSAALLLGDFWERTLNQVAIPLNIAFAVLHLYLLYDEGRPQR